MTSDNERGEMPELLIAQPKQELAPEAVHKKVQMVLNGRGCEFQCKTSDTLLSVLRNSLQLTGAREGCGSGDCGACSVQLNGALVCSCLVLAVECEQAQILTVEGLASADALHPLQQAFLDHDAAGCGVCTPGFLMAAHALLQCKPDPDEADVRHWIAGNLCRCAAYDRVVRAILDSAARLRLHGPVKSATEHSS